MAVARFTAMLMFRVAGATVHSDMDSLRALWIVMPVNEFSLRTICPDEISNSPSPPRPQSSREEPQRVRPRAGC